MIKWPLVFFIMVYSTSGSGQKQIGVWNIRNGNLLLDCEMDNCELANDYWNAVLAILPNDLINRHVVSLRLFTDGRDGDLGGLNQIDKTVNKWQLDLDTVDVNIYSGDSLQILDYSHTLIHEFGHLLTLNPSQIKLTNDIYQDNKNGYLTSEGYAIKNSYLGIFVERFWSDPMLYEWDKIDRKRNERKRSNSLYRFYKKNKDAFVTSYAAESPEEDISESWAFFVLSDKPDLNDIKDQKVYFFYEFPELVFYREEIRKNLRYVHKSYIKQE